MSNVLIRDVSPDDLEEIRAAADARGTSMQAYLRDAVHAQATFLRRQSALRRTEERLAARPLVPEAERQAVIEAVEQAHDERARWIVDPLAP